MKKFYIYAFISLLATYIILSFSLPADPGVLEKHGLTPLSAKLLNLTILIPLSVIYLAALYGFIRVKDYANRISDTREGPPFNNIAAGLTLLAFSLPINAIFSSLGGYIRHAQPHMFSDISIARHYLGLALAFAGIFFISKGAQGLYSTLKVASDKPAGWRSAYGLFGIILLSSSYTWLVTNQAQHGTDSAPFYLPEWAAIFTITVPYIFVWCTGIWSALQIYRYQSSVRGILYKRAIDYLAKGIAGIVLVSIFIQSLTTLSGLLNRLDITPLMLIVYVFIALYAVGYGLVARGARKLKQLEEV